jgi:hypothetical protein
MSDPYFLKFPLVRYANSAAVNIMKRSKIIDEVFSSPYVFHPFELREGDRADTIADQYYDDAYLSWIVYFSNRVVDPYYGWHLSYDDFQKFIVQKYGSIESAQDKVIFYRNNWYNDDTRLTEAFWEDTLESTLKKYWTPEYADYNQVLYYRRKDVDWLINTNMYVKFDVTLNSNTNFANAELVDVTLSANNRFGAGEIIQQNTSVVIIKNVSGNTSANGISITGRESGASANVANSTVVEINIEADEFVYWEAVSYYDYENELNESKRSIKLIDNRYRESVVDQFTQKMAE